MTDKILSIFNNQEKNIRNFFSKTSYQELSDSLNQVYKEITPPPLKRRHTGQLYFMRLTNIPIPDLATMTNKQIISTAPLVGTKRVEYIDQALVKIVEKRRKNIKPLDF